MPVLTIGCLQEAGLDISKAVFVSEEKSEELARYKLAQGDMLFSRMASVGRAGFVTQQFEGALFNYHIMRLRLERSAIDSMLFIYYVRGAKAVQDYVREVNHGATRDGINTEQLLNMPVAVPPVGEQHRIVAEVDRRLSLLRETEAQVDANLKRAERLRQSVLSRAFSGSLLRIKEMTSSPIECLGIASSQHCTSHGDA
ncbi:MAG: restriction endonuclease subunit S [Pseudomonadota bacterium]